MGFFENILYTKKKDESVVLVDIGTTSITGAYVHYQEGQSAMLLYSESFPIDIGNEEEHERAMLRTLATACDELIAKGAPILTRATGSGSADLVLVSIDAPWQETTIRTERFEDKESFFFTKGLVDKRLRDSGLTPSDKVLADESVIGTTLNGYPTREPYGKRAHLATITILTSLIEKRVAHDIIKTVRGAFHTGRILPITGSSLRYQAIRTVFPYEDDAIVLDATSPSLTSIALIRGGAFVMMAYVPRPSDSNEWIAALVEELSTIATQYPLPRTIFLLAHDPDPSELRGKLDDKNFVKLWLSDSPPKIVSVLSSHVSDYVRQLTAEPSDIILLLMIIYYQHRLRKT